MTPPVDPSEKITTCLSYTAALANIFVGLSINNLSIAIGIVLAILTFFINWFYKHKNMRLRESLLRNLLTEKDFEEEE